MFQPKYAINERILGNIKRIGILVNELNNKRFPKIVFAELEQKAREISAFSSTSIEGNPLPLTDVKRILRQAPVHIRDTEKEVLNYNKALEYLREIPERGKAVMTSRLLLDIHVLVMGGLIEKYRLGAFRNEPVFVNDPRTRKTVYLPPEHGDVPALVEDLISFVAENKDSIDPLILAGIFHRQFVIIHPFMDGNGRTARLATKVLLKDMGLDTFNLFSFENYYNKNVGKYFSSVGLSGNYYELIPIVDFTGWLEYFTDGIIDELLRVKKELEAESISAAPRIKSEYAVVIEYLNNHGSINDNEYSKFTKRAKSTRALDFKNMIEQGILERFGKGKSTYYRLKK